MKKMIIMCGIPRSGKSTYADKYYSDYNIVCADDIRLALGTQFDRRLEKIVWSIHDAQLGALLIRGRNVVIDATNITSKLIYSYYMQANHNDYSVEIIMMNTPKSVCLERNTGDGSVPDSVINTMHEKFLTLVREMKLLKDFGKVKLVP